MTRYDNADIIGGVLLGGLGAFIAIYALRYEMGSLEQIGPGVFPVALGLLLILLGAIIAIPAFWRQGQPITFKMRPFLCIVASLLLFSFALRPAGLALTTAGTALLASFATDRVSWRARAGLALVLPILTYLLFVQVLQMIVPIWPRT